MAYSVTACTGSWGYKNHLSEQVDLPACILELTLWYLINYP
jgi:hypothetical protein